MKIEIEVMQILSMWTAFELRLTLWKEKPLLIRQEKSPQVKQIWFPRHKKQVILMK